MTVTYWKCKSRGSNTGSWPGLVEMTDGQPVYYPDWPALSNERRLNNRIDWPEYAAEEWEQTIPDMTYVMDLGL